MLRAQKDAKRPGDVVSTELDLKKRKDQLKEELRSRKNELKEKQSILRKQEKQMKDQHETLIRLEERCRKLQTLIAEKKAGAAHGSPGETKARTQADVEALQAEIREAERNYNEDKKKYKQLIATQENRVKDLSLQLEGLQLELKQKDQESRMNTLKINELKRQLRISAMKPGEEDPLPANVPLPAGTPGAGKVQRTIVKDTRPDPRIAMNVEQLKRDMQAENDYVNSGTKRDGGSIESASLEADTAMITKGGEPAKHDEGDRILMKNEEEARPAPPSAKVEKKKRAGPTKKDPVAEPPVEEEYSGAITKPREKLLKEPEARPSPPQPSQPSPPNVKRDKEEDLQNVKPARYRLLPFNRMSSVFSKPNFGIGKKKK